MVYAIAAEGQFLVYRPIYKRCTQKNKPTYGTKNYMMNMHVISLW
jgi:hypothetical protein